MITLTQTGTLEKKWILGKDTDFDRLFFLFGLYHGLGVGQKTGWYLVHPWITVLILNSPSFSLIFSYLNTLITTVEARNLREFWNERWNEIHIVCSWLGTRSSLLILLFLENIQKGLAWLPTENVHWLCCYPVFAQVSHEALKPEVCNDRCSS